MSGTQGRISQKKIGWEWSYSHARAGGHVRLRQAGACAHTPILSQKNKVHNSNNIRSNQLSYALVPASPSLLPPRTTTYPTYTSRPRREEGAPRHTYTAQQYQAVPVPTRPRKEGKEHHTALGVCAGASRARMRRPGNNGHLHTSPRYGEGLLLNPTQPEGYRR